MSAPVAVVNRAFAEKFFGGGNPIGKRFGNAGATSSSKLEVVGVIADAKYGDLREQAMPMFYLPLYQYLEDRPYQLHVRSTAAPSTVAAAVRREIQKFDEDVTVDHIMSMKQLIQRLLQHDRMFAILAGLFGLLALLLTSIGVYGVVAYQVTRRTGEIGIRMALGAQRSGILWMIMQELLVLLLVGGIVGFPAAIAAGSLLRSILFGLSPSDPAALIAAALILVAAAGVASFVPARRAALLTPMDALRHE